MGTRPSSPTLMTVRWLQTKGHQGQRGTGRRTERFFGGVPGLLGFHFEFAVEFVLVVMEAQVGEMGVCLGEVGDVFAGEEGGETVLPK